MPEESGSEFHYAVPEMRQAMAVITDFLGALDPEPPLEVDNAPDDLLVIAYELPAGNGLAVHLVNATGTWDMPRGARVRHGDPIVFPPLPGNAPISIRLRKPAALANAVCTRAVYRDPQAASTELPVADIGGAFTLSIPPGLVTLLPEG